MRADTVSGNGLLSSLSMNLPVWRVWSHGGRGCGGGRLKLVSPFLSLLLVKVQERPLVLLPFHFVPFTLNFVYGPDFCYISFDLVQLGPLIEINYIFMFHFGPPSFNFRIGFKYLNIFGPEVVIFLILSFD